MPQPLAIVPETQVSVDLALPDHAYHALDLVSASGLKQAARSPLHFLKRNEIEVTDAMDTGSAIHDKMLSPEVFDQKYALWRTEGDRRFGAVKKAWDAFKAEHAGKTILDLGQVQAVEGMEAALDRCQTATKLITCSPYKETSIFWQFAGTGLRLKARVDGIHANGILWDLKSTRDARPWQFSRTIHDGLYHMQLAFYRLAVNLAIERGLLPGAKPISACCIIAVENAAPYGVAVYQLDESALAAGQHQAFQLLAMLEDCYATGKFPGYPDEITTINLPKYAQ